MAEAYYGAGSVAQMCLGTGAEIAVLMFNSGLNFSMNHVRVSQGNSVGSILLSWNK